MRPPERIAAAARQARSCRSLCDRVDQQSLRGFQTDGERVGHTRRAQRGGNGMESRSSCVRRHAGAPTRGPSQNGAMSVVTLPFGRLCRRFGAGDGARLRGRVLGFQHDQHSIRMKLRRPAYHGGLFGVGQLGYQLRKRGRGSNMSPMSDALDVSARFLPAQVLGPAGPGCAGPDRAAGPAMALPQRFVRADHLHGAAA